MTRSPLLAQVLRAIRLAEACNHHRRSTADGMALVEEQHARRLSRREYLATMGKWSSAAAAASVLAPVERLWAGSAVPSVNVGIVGAGLAGLACADSLASAGMTPTVYDAASRVGGRCFSLRDFFPGQVAERGGEFIDNAHKTMLRYAKRFALELEDVSKMPGEVTYFFNGQPVPESVIVDELRAFVPVMRADLRRLSGEVTALSHTPVDVARDNTSLLAYLDGANSAGVPAGPMAREAVIQAYIAEYGLEPGEQSCLNFLFFIHADRRSKFTPFGIFSDERWHVVDGNDRIAQGLAAGLPSPVQHDVALVRVAATAAGAVELTFEQGSSTFVRTHDHVVLAIPFSVLGEVELDVSLGLSVEKLNAIDQLGYGTNAKMMLGFAARPWAAAGSSGATYADLAHVQTTWETNPTSATASRAVITDYSGGVRGATLGGVQAEAERFIGDFDAVYPGAAAAAVREGGALLAHLEHWPSNPLTRGSYTCYRPGQFTTVAGLEGTPAGALHFAGEHANSFYEWQGFMEGAVLSGLQAASEILRS